MGVAKEFKEKVLGGPDPTPTPRNLPSMREMWGTPTQVPVYMHIARLARGRAGMLLKNCHDRVAGAWRRSAHTVQHSTQNHT